MSRLIDADALIALVQDSTILGDGFKYAFVALVKGEPTVDAVEVVRCRDCKEWDEENHWCNIRDSYGWDYKPNGYCSYGVRKAEDDAAD